MDFEVSNEMQDIIGRMHRFVDQELVPMEPRFLIHPFADMVPELEKKRDQVREKGLWAPLHPRELGGMGLSLMDFALVSEALGRSPIGHYVFNCHAPDAGNAELLYLYGNDEQKERYLRPLVDGKIRSCFSMTEPDMPGSNPIMLETTAVRDGDEYVINGRKWFATSAAGATFAVCMAVTDPDAHPYLKASMFLVPTDTPGYRLDRNLPVMGHAGSDWASHGEIVYEDCRVPAANLLGPAGQGFVLAQERLGPGRIHHCMRWIGVCNRCFDLMCDRALFRDIAPGRKLATTQITRTWIAECAAQIQSARLMVLHAAWKVQEQGTHEARQEISLIKFYVANVMQHVIDTAIQIHGGLGVTDLTILAHFYQHERAARIYDGCDEVHKLSVAKRILRERGERS